MKYKIESVDSTFALHIVSRSFSILASLVILRITLSDFVLSDFIQVQLHYGLVSILFWFADLGLLNYSIILFSEKKFFYSKRVMSTRFWLILLFFIIYALIQVINFGRVEVLVLIVAIFFDISTDSLNGFRQVAASMKYSVISLAAKKICQLIFILFIIQQNEKVTLINYSFAILIPSILVFFYDSRFLHFNLRFFDTSYLRKSKDIWFQSGGTSLANFDIPILTSLNGVVAVPVFVVSRKFSNALGIFGSTLVPQSMSDAASNRITTQKSLSRSISVALIVLIFSLVIIVCASPILEKFFKINPNKSNLTLFVAVLLIAPLGVISSNLNALLIATNRSRLAAVATYSSSICYLGLIVIGCLTSKPYIGLVMAVFMNLVIEVCLQLFFLRRELLNE